jgi:site-specific DNA-cytosine methylase
MGKADERHLWPHMLRAIHEIRPTWVVGENVRGIISWDNGLVFEEVHAQLEAEGYEVQAFVLPAAGVDAPHRRDRVWFVAHAKSKRNDRSKGRESTIRERNVFQAEQGRDQMGTEAQGRGGERIVTHADGCTTRSPRTSIGAGESWSNIAQQSSEWRSQTKQHFGCGDVYGMLPTPRTNKATNLNLNSVKLANRNKGNLEEALAQIVVSFLPTPTASDNPAKNTGKMNQDSLQKELFKSLGNLPS